MGADGHLVMFDESTFIEFVICMVLHSFMKRTIDGAIGDYYGDIDGDKIMIYRYYDDIEYRPDQIFDIITDTVSPSDSNMIFSDFYMHIKSDICMKVFPNIDV